MNTNIWQNTEGDLGKEKYTEEGSEKKEIKKEKIVEIPEMGKIRKKKWKE